MNKFIKTLKNDSHYTTSIEREKDYNWSTAHIFLSYLAALISSSNTNTHYFFPPYDTISLSNKI